MRVVVDPYAYDSLWVRNGRQEPDLIDGVVGTRRRERLELAQSTLEQHLAEARNAWKPSRSVGDPTVHHEAETTRSAFVKSYEFHGSPWLRKNGMKRRTAHDAARQRT